MSRPGITTATATVSMFVVDDSTAAVIRRAYDEGGEFAAAIELRRHFPDITDNAAARRCARAIAGWLVLPPAEKRQLTKKRGRVER
jgi:hypothetical protein